MRTITPFRREFFVTGLPRSRTAWLANFLTAGDSFCFHELLAAGVSASFVQKTFSRMIEEESFSVVGDSDSALVAIAPAMVAMFPTARWVLVERPVDEAMESYQKAFGTHQWGGLPKMDEGRLRQTFAQCLAWCETAKRVIAPSNLLVVPFDTLNKSASVRAIWDWCLPGKEWSEHRFSFLDKLLVEVVPAKMDTSDIVEAWRKVL
jgi:hypothetical protein